MRIRVLFGIAAVSVILGGCPNTSGNFVTTQEFTAYKARIKADGDSVDEWVAAAHKWILWLNANSTTFCPNCGVPPLPPDPPPDPNWE